MGCRCNERKASLQRAGVAIVGGNIRGAAREIAQSTRTLVQDARSAEARRQMLARLASLRKRSR
jgi:hypothetical protein